jgi:N-acetylglucosamine-6-phosphate deacetylase
MITQGLTDLQVNGYAGIDFNDATLTPDAMDHALAAMRAANVVACLPTLITAGISTLQARLAALDHAVAASRLGPIMVPGFHLEGPFLNPAPGYAGCHPPEAMILPDPAVLERLTDNLRRPIVLLTIAPERPGAEALIRYARGKGTIVAMGHTNAATIPDGIALSTHLGNALPRPAHKFLNPLMLQLADDRLDAGFIADGIHIPPHALKVMLRAKTAARSILVTDATAAASASPGLYPFAGMTIERTEDGTVRLPGTATLAGSALTLDQAVRNIVAWGLADKATAIAMASAHPNALLARHGFHVPYVPAGWTDDLRPAAK